MKRLSWMLAVILSLSMSTVAFAAAPGGGATLSHGDTGNSVAILQADLADLGYHPGTVTGDYTWQTFAAVRQFQWDNGLVGDGVAGSRTWAAIDAQLTRHFHAVSGPIGTDALTIGDYGPAVRTLQGDLLQFGFLKGWAANGVFLQRTGDALMAYQRDRGLPVTEQLDAATYRQLLADFGLRLGSGSGNSGSNAGSGNSGSQQGSGSAGGPATPGDQPLVLGYYVEWAGAGSDTSFARYANDMTAISPFWTSIRANGSLRERGVGDEAQVIARAHARGKQVLILVTNGGTSAFLYNQTAFHAAVNHVVGQVRALGADGVNIDFEAISPSNRNGLTRFTKAVAAKLRPLGKLTTVAVGPNFSDDPSTNPLGQLYDYVALGKVCDYVVVMTYDFHGSGSGPGAVAPISWVRRVATYAASKMPARKVVLGLADYGYQWPGGSIPNGDAAALAARHGARILHDPASGEAHFSYWDGSGKHTVWFEDTASIQSKLALVKQLHLGGVAVWRLGHEQAGYWPAIGRSLLGR